VLIIIIWADDHVMRLWSMFMHYFSVVHRTSQGRASRELGDVSYMTVWRVLCKRLSFRPYKFKLLLELKPK
jgi:hypothetical protein